MFRFLVVVALGVALTIPGLFFAWGEKEVNEASCEGTFYSAQVRTVESCHWQRTDARYWSDHITADFLTWETEDGEPVDPGREFREMHDYKLSGQKLEGNAALAFGRPITWLGIGLIAVALGYSLAARRGVKQHQMFATWSILGAACTVGFGAVLGLGGMVIHAGTWAGRQVSSLTPEVGAFLLAGGSAVTVWGAVRYFNTEMARIEGRNTPLAPLYAERAPEQESIEGGRFSWSWMRWPDPRPFAIIGCALVLLVAAAPIPLAAKDITVRECPDTSQSGGGFNCTVTAYHVQYQAFGASVFNGTSTDFQGYVGAFQAHHDQTFIEIVPFVATASVAAGGWLAWSSWKTRRLLWPTVAMSIGLLLWIVPVVHHSMHWAGVPAGSLHAAIGVIGLAIAGAALWFAVICDWRGKTRATRAD